MTAAILCQTRPGPSQTVPVMMFLGECDRCESIVLWLLRGHQSSRVFGNHA